LRHFPGGYQYYLDKTSQTAREALTSSSQAAVKAAPKPSLTGAERKEQKRLEAEQRQARSKQRQGIQLRISTLEKEIAALELKERELAAELELPEAYNAGGRATHINRELMEIGKRLPQATAEWEAANAEMTQFEITAAAAK
jgi:ATP-binding cassette subfamily F protein 3